MALLHDSWVAYFRTQSRWNLFIDFTEEHKSYGQKLRSVMQTTENTKVRFQEETERQGRCVRADAWRLAKNILKLKEKGQSYIFSPTNEWCLPAPSVVKPEEREFVVDSGASMHMLSRKDLDLCRIGNRKGLQKSDDGCRSQRRSANKRRSDRVCQRNGFSRDSKASRICTGRSLTRKTLR